MRVLKGLMITGGLLMAVGCSSGNMAKPLDAQQALTPADNCRGGCVPAVGASDTPAAPASTGTGDDPSTTGYDSGSTAALTLSGGTSTLAQMFYNSNPNNPTNVRVNINLQRQTDSVIISYVDGGRVVEAGVGVVHPYSGISRAQFNGWVNQNGKSVYKAFFQDSYGAVVLIIDKMLSQGDGQPGEFMGGSVWFQNFNRYYPNAPLQGNEKMCWEISMGPYDCRTFLVGDTVSMGSSQYPNNKGPNANSNYVKLGDFSGISRKAAGL
jgi:hypothetical protein